MDVVVASPWIPAEWIKAHGHNPCGVWFHPGFGSQRLRVAEGICPFAQRVLSFAQEREESAFVFSSHCDEMRRAWDSFNTLASGRSFLFNLPATWQTPAASRLIGSELKRLGSFLVNLGGHAPTSQLLVRELGDYRMARTELARAGKWCYGSPYAKAIAQFHQEGSFRLPSQGEPAGNTPARETGGKVRLALVGGPLGTAGLPLIEEIEGLDGEIVVNATETGERTLAPILPEGQGNDRLDAVGGTVETLADALARTILDQCVDVFQRPNTRLYAWLENRLAERRVQGLILWCHVWCDLWRAEAESLREAFGLPLLLLEADDSGGGSPRNTGRIQAFLEALR